MALFRSALNNGSRIIIRNIRMSTNLNEKAAEAVEKMKVENPFFNKYADKIVKLQKTSPEDFLSRVQKQEVEKSKKETEEKGRDYSELMNPKTSADTKSELPFKKLEDIMKIELLQDQPAEEIGKIWLAYHKNKDVIAAAIPTMIFNKLFDTAKKFPLFIFPIPRSQGYEFIMFQFAANTVHFTPLLCYQVHKENAPECLNMVHYTEFQDKGIVLMRGEYDSKVISAKEAQCLANQLQLYYTQNSPSKLKLLEAFTKAPESFKHMDVIRELENLEIA